MRENSAKQLTKQSPSATYSISIDSDVVYVHSNTFMNESSKAWLSFTKSEKKTVFVGDGNVVLVLYDDFESELGSVKLSRFKKNESHNGLKDLKKVVDDGDGVFLLGIGIGPKPVAATRDTMARWVLSPFNANEKARLDNEVLDLVNLYIGEIESVGGEKSDVNKFNARMKKMWKSQQQQQE
ncbi:pth Peptidyl-tRNA hydrolase [Candida maltosa Xu316]